MGSCTSFLITPGGALTLGAVAGGTGAIAFTHLQSFSHRVLKIEDTFGSLSTYLIPGIIGGLAGVVSTAIAADKDNIFGADYNLFFPKNAKDQAGYHMAVLVISAAVGFVASIPLALALRYTALGDTSHFYTDETEWDVPTDFEAHIDTIEDKNIEMKPR